MVAEATDAVGETLHLPAVVKMSEIIRGKQFGDRLKHSFVSRYCWKMSGKHCQSSEETNTRQNYTVACCTDSWMKV